jgi:Transposase IS200 like
MFCWEREFQPLFPFKNLDTNSDTEPGTKCPVDRNASRLGSNIPSGRCFNRALRTRLRLGFGDRVRGPWPARHHPFVPLAYFITFSTYGSHLHGEERGSVDKHHNQPDGPFAPRHAGRLAAMHGLMKAEPELLDHQARQVVLVAILGICTDRAWAPLAIHVRSNHVHAVVAANAPAELVLKDLKGYASRDLNRHTGEQRPRWTRGGSTRYLWDPISVDAAVRYVVENQGRPTAVYQALSFSDAVESGNITTFDACAEALTTSQTEPGT